MLAVVLVATLVSVAPSPGDGLGLAPAPRPPASSVPPLSFPTMPVGVGLGVAGAAALGAARPKPRGRRGRSMEPFYVLVPGHGGAAADFDALLAMMEVDDTAVASFDYSWSMPGVAGVIASQRVSANDAADALDTFLRVLAREHGNIYVIAHSKGGAVVTELVSRWDEEPGSSVAAVSGAALLDPAIGTGVLGDLQRIGFAADDVPDNGMFDPIACGWFSCRDVRAELGRRAGVEVIAVRNRDALVTNFADTPDGLRVYDLDDGGPHPMRTPWDLGAVLARIREAHTSVLRHRVVADCIAAEAAAPASCRWPGVDAPPVRRGSGRAGGGPVIV